MKRVLEGKIEVISADDLIKSGKNLRRSYHDEYYSMYSSVWNGILTDPVFMTVPIDDHMVHRGDAVFEAFKCVEGNLYNVRRHLDRLQYSASLVGIELPYSKDDILEIVKQTIRVSGREDCLVRLFVSRGPGGFTTDPYECPESQLYVVITSLHHLPRVKYEQGVRVKLSKVPIKPSFFANVKSCNYLPNVLMKKEAIDNEVDFVIPLDEKGYLSESSTENFGLVAPKRELLFPKFDRILRGTTVVRVAELAKDLLSDGTLNRVDFVDVSVQMAREAEEMMMFGTTFDVLPVVIFEGEKVGSGKPGEIYEKLYRLLVNDIRCNREMQEPVYGP